MKQSLWPANIIFDIGGVLFRSSHGHPQYKDNPLQEPPPGIYVPLEEGIALLKACAEVLHEETQIPLHKLYVLSNWKGDRFAELTEHHSDIFNLFTGIAISGTVGLNKPDPRFYQHLLNQYQLHPGESIFIDDFSENVDAAQQLGITGIHHTCPHATRKQLETLGILPKTNR